MVDLIQKDTIIYSGAHACLITGYYFYERQNIPLRSLKIIIAAIASSAFFYLQCARSPDFIKHSNKLFSREVTQLFVSLFPGIIIGAAYLTGVAIDATFIFTTIVLGQIHQNVAGLFAKGRLACRIDEIAQNIDKATLENGNLKKGYQLIKIADQTIKEGLGPLLGIPNDYVYAVIDERKADLIREHLALDNKQGKYKTCIEILKGIKDVRLQARMSLQIQSQATEELRDGALKKVKLSLSKVWEKET